MAKSNSPKYRDYFITINQGAECYETALDAIREMNFVLYAAIYHDKDYIVNEDGTTTLKPKHLHIMVELKNPVSFDGMCRRLMGAHIESPKYKKSAYQYLLHNSPNSKDKYQYGFDEIITSSPESVKAIIASETFEVFKENEFLRYMAQGCKTPYQFAKRFGLNAYRQYWKPYCEMLTQLRNDEEMKRDMEEMMLLLEKEEDGALPW